MMMRPAIRMLALLLATASTCVIAQDDDFDWLFSEPEQSEDSADEQAAEPATDGDSAQADTQAQRASDDTSADPEDADPEDADQREDNPEPYEDTIAVDQGPPPQPRKQPPSGPLIEEIVVTANRREETLQDYVGGIQVFSGEELDKSGANGVEDYVFQIPGAGFKREGNGTTNVAIRGISNITQVFNGLGDGVSTVGIYINDVPIRGGASMPDLGLYDLARIEVLKGPQGTLYGEGAMGGAIRMLLQEPDRAAWASKGDLSLSQTSEGDLSWNGRLATGGPIGDEQTMGIRLVGTRRRDGGFVDYVARGIQDEDEDNAASLRGLFDWDITDKFKLGFLALGQQATLDNFHEVDPREGELANAINEDRYNDTSFLLGGLTLKYDFGFAELTLVTGAHRNNRESQIFSPLLTTVAAQGISVGVGDSLGPVGPALAGVATTVFTDIVGQNLITEEYQFFTTDQDSLSQEFRLVSNGENRLHWIAGLYLSKNETASYQEVYAPDLQPEPRLITGDGVETFEQISGYGEAIYTINDRFEITAGLRAFREETTIFQIAETYGALALAQTAGGQDPQTITDSKSSSSDLLPKISLSWEINDNHNLYALASKGFRSGGNNVASTFHEFKSYEPDFLWNYEVGLKNKWWGGKLNFNISAYLLDWENTQAVATVIGMLGPAPAEFIAIQNVGAAEVMGSEIELSALLPKTVLTASVGINRSEIKSTDASGTIIPGEPLPNQPELTGSLGVTVTPFQWSFASPSLNVSWTYTDEQLHLAKTDTVPDGDLAPAFDLLNVRLGLDALDWGVSLFANNVLDERPVLSRSALREGEEDQIFSTNRPRTIGLMLRSDF